MGFDVSDQLLIINSAFVMFLGKEWNTMRQCINYLWTSRKTDSVKMEVMCNILFQFGIPVEMVKVIK